MPVKMCSRQVVSRRLYVRSTAALNDHLRGDSDDDDDGADEDVAQAHKRPIRHRHRMLQ